MVATKTFLAVAALSLFQHAHATNFKLPPCLEPFRPFVYSGCFQDGSPRTLEYRSGQSTRNMTIEACVAECKGNGFRYAGLEYYGECYCGATVNSPVLDQDQCRFPCNGNSSQICGGNDALSIYQDPTFTTQPHEVDIEDYANIGCYTDDGGNGRSLPWPRDIPHETFTPALCLSACRDRGFPFAGTEYGQECYCGSVMGNFTTEAPAGDCNMPCRGDPSQICGGRSRLTLYVARELLSLEPCGHKPPVNSTSSTTIPTPTPSSSSSKTSAPPDTSSVSSETSSVSSESSTVSSETSTSSSKTSTSYEETPTSSSETPTSSSETSTSSSKTSTSYAETPTPSSKTSTSSSKTYPSSSKTSTSSSKTYPSSSKTSTSSSKTYPSSSKTSTSSSKVYPSSSKTSVPPGTTTAPSTTTKFTSTKTSSSALCTTTVAPPTECEYKVGTWCCPHLPDFEHGDGCLEAWKSCSKLVTSCWKYAGFPASLECLNFSNWCGGIKKYCNDDCKGKTCSKKKCFDKNKPHNPSPPKPPVTSVYPCPTSTTVRTSIKPSSTSTVPEPTNICKQPTSKLHNYGPGNPVGGIELPVVTCNDIKKDLQSRPFKLFTEPDSRNCKTYSRPYCSDACKDACKEQYEECKETYVESCKPGWSWNNGGVKESHLKAYERCTAQYVDCLIENAYVDPGNSCKN